MSALLGEFRKGEDVRLALDAMSGDPASVTAVTAAMRKVRLAAGLATFVEDAPAIAVTVTPRAAAGDVPAGWTLSVAAAVTKDLAAGYYGLDAKLTVAGGTEITDRTAVITLSEAALA